MHESQLLMIKQSWSQVLLQSEKTGELFYQTLFWDDPSLRFLFGTDLTGQVRKFIDMMTFIVNNAQHLDDYQTELKALAQRHVDYGVLSVDYDTVGDALLKTLATVLQDQWTPDMKTAWEEFYRTLTRIMLNSLKSAS